VLEEARSEAERLDCRRILWEVLWELSAIVDARGDTEAAKALRAEARGLVERIAESLDDEELRSSFLDRSDVIAVRSAR
jgi:hypothetical protein